MPGFQQQAGFDYFKTFTPVVKWETIWIVNGLAIHRGWPIHHLNVQTAFLNWVFDEEVYVVQPNGLATLSIKHLICQLYHTLYGLKQSPYAWYSRMDSALLQACLIKSRVNSNL